MSSFLKHITVSTILLLSVPSNVALGEALKSPAALSGQKSDCVELSDYSQRAVFNIHTGALVYSALIPAMTSPDTSNAAPSTANISVSPDQKYTVTDRDNGDSTWSLVLYDADTHSSVSIALPANINSFASWSPDSSVFIYESATYQIVWVDARTAAAQILDISPLAAGFSSFQWSPDGTVLMATGTPSEKTMIYGPVFAVFFSTAGVKRPSVIQVAANAPNYVPRLWWSFDHRLAYVPGDGTGLRLINPVDGADVPLNIPAGSQVWDIRWSPSGQYLALLLIQGSLVPRWYLFNAQTLSGKRLGALGLFAIAHDDRSLAIPYVSSGWAHWSPNGQRIDYVQDGDTLSMVVYHVNTDTYENLPQVQISRYGTDSSRSRIQTRLVAFRTYA